MTVIKNAYNRHQKKYSSDNQHIKEVKKLISDNDNSAEVSVATEADIVSIFDEIMTAFKKDKNEPGRLYYNYSKYLDGTMTAFKKNKNEPDRIYYNYLFSKQEFRDRVKNLSQFDFLDILKKMYNLNTNNLVCNLIDTFKEIFQDSKYNDIKIELFKMYINSYISFHLPISTFDKYISSIKIFELDEIVRLFEDIIQDEKSTSQNVKNILKSVDIISTNFGPAFNDRMRYGIIIKATERIKAMNDKKV
jgi:hypothetical protein